MILCWPSSGDLDLVSLCFFAAFSCLTCSKEPNNIICSRCGLWPAARSNTAPSSCQPCSPATGHSLGQPCRGWPCKLIWVWSSFWFPGWFCAGVATGMDWCAIAHPKCILILQQAMSMSWDAWCITVHLKHYGWRFCFGSCGAQLNVPICATEDVSVFLLHAKKRVLWCCCQFRAKDWCPSGMAVVPMGMPPDAISVPVAWTEHLWKPLKDFRFENT